MEPSSISGSTPEFEESLSGVLHQLSLTTAYYTANIPVWLDVTSSPQEWRESFLSDEAKEVLEALGGLVVVFRANISPKETAAKSDGSEQERDPTPGDLVREIGQVLREGLGGWDWDGVALAVGVGNSDAYFDEWEDLCAELGFEFTPVRNDARDTQLNEFGEKTGCARITEALQANNWESGAGGDDNDGILGSDDEDPFGLDADNLDFAMGDPSDFEGLRQAIWGEIAARHTAAQDTPETKMQTSTEKPSEISTQDTTATTETAKDGDPKKDTLAEEDVEKLEKLMLKLKATRELGEGMPEEQRKKLAKKAVMEVMREL
ncbi:hypothetical protein TD95_000925 [Thielaviopsis punctulata]|uniref:Alpha and gamma adaptin binding protein p34 n=1 Tax=Thielaviopsis punctulata TaxID=72032 RepID=A0A0F4ZEF6_9PEZI|nr:hypothetical protein TD95_000925 [Thielaviopsis punctulata]